MRRRLWMVVLVVLIGIGVPTTGFGQAVFNAVVNTPAGATNALFQQQNGAVTQIPTGLVTNDYPSLSRDGRFIAISAPDPARPNQASTDLFLYDRATGQRRHIVDNTTEELTGGGFGTTSPQFSAFSPNNQLIAVASLIGITTPGMGASVTPKLSVHRLSDGFEVSLVELGAGSAIDFFRAEYVGISWAPDGTVFAVPAYVQAATATGNPSSSVGISLVAFDPTVLAWRRAGQITTPRIFDDRIPFVIETHIFPSFSPSGRRLAYFEITWPDALRQGAPRARLVRIESNGANPTVLATFNPGFYPLGLIWSPDGTQLIFSIAQQQQGAGQFLPYGLPETAVIRAVNSESGGTPTALPGLNAGFFPLLPLSTSGGGNPGGSGSSLSSSTPVQFRNAPGGGFTLSVPGLDPTATFRLESTTGLGDFPNSRTFTGQQVMDGIAIPRNEREKYFRLREVSGE